MSSPIKIAAAQIDISLGQVERNVDRLEQVLRETATAGAALTVFPECALTGYCFDSLEEAAAYAEPAPGPSTQRLAGVCAELGVHAVFGMLESEGSLLYNACLLVGPDGLIGKYRKVHLPYLGVDRFTTAGAGFDVWDAGDLRLGMNICYDGAFPESARVMALDGADLIALPTNWPPGAEETACYVINARAMENNVYYAAVNRVGQERGFTFIGQSKICDPAGRPLAAADHQDEAILYADVDPQRARQKRLVRVPGKHIIDRFADRRPECYGKIVEPNAVPAPSR